MNLVWKRPDGFIGATPDDFLAYPIEDQCSLWLHKRDHDTYPFRLSGGWQETEASSRLNRLVNLLPRPDGDLVDHLLASFHRSMSEDAKAYWQEQDQWLSDLVGYIKGDHWEIELVKLILNKLRKRHARVRDAFLLAAG